MLPELRKLQEKYRTKEGGTDVCAGIKGLMEQAKTEAEASGFKKGEANGIKKGEKNGIKKGEARGIKKGEARLASLITELSRLGRNEDITKAAANVKYRKKLYVEVGIT